MATGTPVGAWRLLSSERPGLGLWIGPLLLVYHLSQIRELSLKAVEYFSQSEMPESLWRAFDLTNTV